MTINANFDPSVESELEWAAKQIKKVLEQTPEIKILEDKLGMLGDVNTALDESIDGLKKVVNFNKMILPAKDEEGKEEKKDDKEEGKDGAAAGKEEGKAGDAAGKEEGKAADAAGKDEGKAGAAAGKEEVKADDKVEDKKDETKAA